MTAPLLGDRFEILREVGRGGMGRIFEARDHQDGAHVAVKIVRTPDLDATARFAREARMLAMAQHPCVVRVLGHGMFRQEGPYLAMEWIPGPTLADVLTANPPGTLRFDDVVGIGMRVASALASFETRGIVHRDLKAGNVMLREADPRKATLIDFGAARSVHEKIPLTMAGRIVGTPMHLAPEQAEGGSDVGTPIDVWALGVLLYQMLTSTLPFESERLVALIMKIVTDDAPDVRRARPDVPRALAELVNGCLHKDPAARPRAEEALHLLVGMSGDSSEGRQSLLDDVGFRESVLLGDRDTFIDPQAEARALLAHQKRGA